MLNTAPHYGKSYIIFAIDYHPGLSVVAQNAQFQQWADLMGIPVKPLKECWEGEIEYSWIAPAEHIERIRHAYAQNQAAILALTPVQPDGFRRAFLEWTKGERKEELGRWEAVSREIAERERSYTYDPTTKTYWLAREQPAIV